MRETACDVLIVGGGTGGCAAAMAACAMGMRVVMTEETDWIGGQLTAQLVPPDEHPWIESCGCTARYRRYRELVRAYYRAHRPLTREAFENPWLNPGGGWVSRLCHEPAIGLAVLREMLGPYVARGLLEIRLRRVAVDADASRNPHPLPPPPPAHEPSPQGEGDTRPLSAATVHPPNPPSKEGFSDRVRSVRVLDLETGAEEIVSAKVFLDATELGDLLPMTGTDYVVGAESRAETGEANAVDGPAEPDNVQGLTWCMAMALDEGSHRVIDRPASYERWRAYKPDFWPGPLLGFDVLHAHTGKHVKLPLFADDWYALFPYRQIVDPSKVAPEDTDRNVRATTVVNWPQNDYFLESIIDVDPAPDLATGVPLARGKVSAARLLDAKELSWCLLYWLQTAAPRHDGGVGYPGLYLRPDMTGTTDGFAKTAYIRESRRVRARFTVREQDVSTAANPGVERAPSFDDSVGVGAYRIDLHPSTNGKNTIDCSTLPFEIPMGSLIPVGMRNLLPACKNLGVTHITNGCYRLHPIEWNIGEAAGALAGFAILRGVDPSEVYDDLGLRSEFLESLSQHGIERRWPVLRGL